ncbi:hypothetical protein B0H19DRAFT_1064763 [Mycena capillaripes]|nr:hypothetical protein B0H19DRAFT_1064763 [Mycena capillaripes]
MTMMISTASNVCSAASRSLLLVKTMDILRRRPHNDIESFRDLASASDLASDGQALSQNKNMDSLAKQLIAGMMLGREVEIGGFHRHGRILWDGTVGNTDAAEASKRKAWDPMGAAASTGPQNAPPHQVELEVLNHHNLHICQRILRACCQADPDATLSPVIFITFQLRDQAGFELYVGNLSWKTTVECVAIRDRETGRMRGFGHEEADAAISQWNEQQLDGRNLRVNPAERLALRKRRVRRQQRHYAKLPSPFRRSTRGGYGGDTNNSSGSLCVSLKFLIYDC